MFIDEKVAEEDKELFEKVSGLLYNNRLSKWCVDREDETYIVCRGKHGVETPVVFRIYFKDHLFEFIIPEPDILYGGEPVVFVRLPVTLEGDRSTIEGVIKRAFREASEISGYGSLPRNIDDHTFDFESYK